MSDEAWPSELRLHKDKKTLTVSFDGGLDCGYVLIGKSVSVQFDSPGSYHYVDKIVPQYMSGTVTVQ